MTILQTRDQYGPLFDRPSPASDLSRRTDPRTSDRAARAFVKTGGKATHEIEILRILRASPRSLTTAEIARESGLESLDKVAAGKRMRALVRAGVVAETGERECEVRGRKTLAYAAIGGGA